VTQATLATSKRPAKRMIANAVNVRREAGRQNPNGMRLTPYAQQFRGVANSHARLRYAGGSWRSSRPVGLSVPVGTRRFDGEPGAGSNCNSTHGWCRQHANHDGHIPATGASRLLEVLIQRFVIVIDGVPMRSAIGMDVSNLVMMRAGLMLKMTAGKAVVIKAHLCCRCFRGGNEGRLERERNHGRHHDNGRDSPKERPHSEAQLAPPKFQAPAAKVTPPGPTSRYLPMFEG
jgi:hypothetical protein